jgi:hypothetical protein
MRQIITATLKHLPLIAVLGYSTQASALNMTPTASKAVTSLYAVLLMKSTVLPAFSEKFPDLVPEINRVDGAFKTHFPNIDAQLDAQLKRFVPEAAIREQLHTLGLKSLTDKMQMSTPNRQGALDFIHYIDDLNHGRAGNNTIIKIDNKLVQDYLLTISYEAHPEQELQQGFVQHYQTDPSISLGGKRLSLDLPISWMASPNPDQNGVQQWLSEHGVGRQRLTLTIADAPNPQSPAEIKRSLDNGEVASQFKLYGKELLSSSAYRAGMLPGFSLRFNTTDKTPDLTLYGAAQTYQIYALKKNIILTCSTGGELADKAQIDAEFSRFQPLCQQVAESLRLSTIK